MNTLRITSTLTALSLLVMSNSCEKNNATMAEPASKCTRTGYIIGMAPCNSVDNIGIILALESPRDTVYTYNLPANVFTYTPNLGANGQSGGLFSAAVIKNNKITLGYYPTPKNERRSGICQWNIYNGRFIQMTGDKQITITCANKE